MLDKWFPPSFASRTAAGGAVAVVTRKTQFINTIVVNKQFPYMVLINITTRGNGCNHSYKTQAAHQNASYWLRRRSRRGPGARRPLRLGWPALPPILFGCWFSLSFYVVFTYLYILKLLVYFICPALPPMCACAHANTHTHTHTHARAHCLLFYVSDVFVKHCFICFSLLLARVPACPHVPACACYRCASRARVEVCLACPPGQPPD